MITGNINNPRTFTRLHPSLQQGLEAAHKLISEAQPDGKYTIDGDNLFVLLMSIESKDVPQCRPEFHAKYTDIQICVQGQEFIGYSNQQRGEAVEEDKLENHDVAFTKTINDERFVELNAGDFAVFFEQEMHRPGCHMNAPQQTIRKAVVKIHSDLFVL